MAETRFQHFVSNPGDQAPLLARQWAGLTVRREPDIELSRTTGSCRASVITSNQGGQHCGLPTPMPLEGATLDDQTVGGGFKDQIEGGDWHVELGS